MVLSIDPGSKESGIAVIWQSELSGSPLEGFNERNDLIVGKIRKHYVKYNPIVVIEDLRYFPGRISMQVLDTVKFIGELNYRLKVELGLKVEYVTRGKVKKWVFDTFPEECKARIDKKIAYLDAYGEKTGKRRYVNQGGTRRKASFHWVDDRIVIAVMKEFWGIPTPKPGKKNIYGFCDDSWQALASGTYFLNKITSEILK